MVNKSERFNRLLSSDLALVVREWELRGKPRQDGVDWPLQEWLTDFPEYETFLTGLKAKNLGLLDRKLVRDVTLGSISSGKLELGFLACMIWGFGGRGYAQHRTRKIVSSPNFEKILRDTVQNLQNGDIAGAYTSLIEKGPEGLGCSFGSKYLYFASPEDIAIRPIIVDALIAKAISEMTLFRVDSARMDSHRYVKLIEEFSQAAQSLGFEPDVLEEILFDAIARNSGASGWSSSIPLKVSDQEKKAWVLSLIVDMIRKGELVEVERTHPGGGQYDCIGIKSHSGFEVEFNVRGSIHIFKPVPSHIGWESAFKLGLLEVSRRLRSNRSDQERAMPSLMSDSYSWLSRALMGKAEIEVQDFESFLLLTGQQRAQFKALEESLSAKEMEASFVLINDGELHTVFIPKKGLVFTSDGKKIEIESDCYMPVENYIGEQ
jgi:hypothetical protein